MVKSFSYTATAVGGATPESGALTYVTLRNTSTPYTVKTDSGLTTNATNPAVADADGRIAPLYFPDDADITFTVKTANQATTLLLVDYRSGTFHLRSIQEDQVAIDEIELAGDGVTTTFDLEGVAIDSPFNVIVMWDGALQEAGSYNVATDGTDTAITFASAPPRGARVFARTFALQAISPAVTSYSGVDVGAASVTASGGATARTLADWTATQTRVVANYAALLTEDTWNNKAVLVLGRTTTGIGGGLFRFTTTSSTTAVTNDPQQGIYVAPTASPTGSAGVWIRILDNPRVVTPQMFGAIGNGSTDDYTALQAAIDWLEITQTGKYRGGTLLLTSRYACSDNLLIDSTNITIMGDGNERSSAGASVNGAPAIIGTKTTEPVILVRAGDTNLIGFEVGASTARQAGTTQTGDNTVCGVMVATADAASQAMNSILIQDVLARDQVDDGFHVCGDIATITMIRCSAKDNDRHGFHVDDGTLAGRSNLGRPGILTITDCRAVDSGGYGIATGHPSDGVNAPYRVVITNFEGYRNGLTTGKLYSGYESSHFLRGEQIVTTASGFAGTDANNAAARSCFVVSAASALFSDCRYVEAGGTHFVSVQDIAGFTTRFVRFEGGFATVTGSALTQLVSIEAGSLQCRIDNVRGRPTEYLAYSDKDTLTIASGVVAAIFEHHLIDTEGAAATDDVATINGGAHDQIVRFRSANSGRDPTFKNGTGNIVCGSDRTLSNVADEIAFRYDETAAKWNMIYFADNA